MKAPESFRMKYHPHCVTFERLGPPALDLGYGRVLNTFIPGNAKKKETSSDSASSASVTTSTLNANHSLFIFIILLCSLC